VTAQDGNPSGKEDLIMRLARLIFELMLLAIASPAIVDWDVKNPGCDPAIHVCSRG